MRGISIAKNIFSIDTDKIEMRGISLAKNVIIKRKLGLIPPSNEPGPSNTPIN